MDEAQRGAKALSASEYRTAIDHYTRALIVNPHATDYYIKRSTAYSRLKPAEGGPNGAAALHDAELAVALGIQRARREQILAGQMRRGIALFQLGRFGDADFVFKHVRGKVGPPPSAQKSQGTMESAMSAAAGGGGSAGQKDSTSNELQIWEMQVKGRLSKLDPGDEKVAVTVKEYPDLKVPEQEELKKLYQAQLSKSDPTALTQTTRDVGAPVDKEKSQTATNTTSSSETKQPTQPSAAPKGPVTSTVRHEWYQSSETVVITLYAKGVPKDKADIDIQERSLSITFPLATGSDYSFNLEPLFASIDPSASKASVMSTKIEIVLRKKQVAQKWAGLEGTAGGETDKPLAAVTPSAPSTTTPATAPSYPSSARGGAKDWDKLASSLDKKEKKKKDKKGNDAEGGNDAGEESDDSEYGSGDPVDSFFKKIYAKADPDTQRAMMKSYYESEGTALSTNWSEVSKGKVEAKPPSDD